MDLVVIQHKPLVKTIAFPQMTIRAANCRRMRRFSDEPQDINRNACQATTDNNGPLVALPLTSAPAILPAVFNSCSPHDLALRRDAGLGSCARGKSAHKTA